MGSLVDAEWHHSSRVNHGVDVHVLPNFEGPDLREWMRITNDERREYRLNDPNPDPDISTIFRPRFRASVTGNSARGFGVEVTTTTGETEFDLSVPARNPARPAPTDAALRLHNFLLVATVTGPHPHDAAPAQRTIDLPIRVHLHESIVRVWATPATFNVPQDVDRRQRITIFAEFDDEIIGDITYWNFVDQRFFNWRLRRPQAGDSTRPDENVPFPDATVNSRGFRLRNNPAIGTEFFVLADLQDGAVVTHVISVRVRVGDPLLVPTQVTRLDASGPPSTLSHLSHIRNVLFVPEGFASTQANNFVKLARGVCAKLQSEQVAIPFNTLRDSTMFWHAWKGFAEAGVTVRREVRIREREGKHSGKAVPLVNAPTQQDDPWDYKELLYEFGFPVPAERSMDEATMITRWLDRYEPASRTGQNTVPVANRAKLESLVSEANFRKWRRYAVRTFINHVDSAFNFSHGLTTSAKAISGYRSLKLNSNRQSSTDLRHYLHNLQTAAGIDLGHGWTDPHHKDFGLICFLVNTDAGGGTNTGDHMTIGIRTQWIGLTKISGRKEYTLKPEAVAEEPSLDTYSTVAHELAHSYHLDDEYGNGRAFHHLPRSRERFSRLRANTQPLRDLGQGNNFDVTAIKWNWHRIKRAAPLHDHPSKQGDASATMIGPGDVVHVPLLINNLVSFQTGMIVRLRQRPLSVVSQVTDRLRITAIDNGANALLMTVQPGSVAIDLTDFRLPGQPGRLNQPLTNATRPGQDARPGDTIEAQLDAGHGARFRDGEFVTLRETRNGLIHTRNVRFQVTVSNDTLSMVMDPSRDELSITGWSAPDEIISLNLPPIVFQVVENEGDAAPAGYGPDLRIIAPKVWAHLMQHRAPLTRAASGDPCEIPEDDDKPQKPLSIPNGIPMCTPRDRAQIIAIYDGGDGYHCGLVHPSGHSNMRNPLNEDDTAIVPFDHVSRYVMVDLHNPRRHFVIDRLYDRIYPHS